MPIFKKYLQYKYQYQFKKVFNTLAILKKILALLAIAMQYCNINNPDYINVMVSQTSNAKNYMSCIDFF